MATVYVSNQALNGYSTGSDSNTYTQAQSKSTPWLTIAHAAATISANDTIVVNPGNEYTENSGSSYLQLSIACTLETDQTLTSSVGKAKITSAAAGTRTIGIGANVAIVDIQVDCGSNSRSNITIQPGDVVTLTRIDHLNVAGTNPGVLIANGGAANTTLDKNTMTSANGNAVTAFLCGYSVLTSGTISLTGCTVNGLTSGGLIEPDGGTGAVCTINIGASADGTQTTVANSSFGVYLAGGGTQTLSVSNLFYTGTGRAIWDQGSATATLTSFTLTNSYFASTGSAPVIAFVCSGALGLVEYNYFSGNQVKIQVQSATMTNWTVQNNQSLSTNLAGDEFSFLAFGAGLVVQNNVFNSGSTTHMVCVGGDGYSVGIENIAASTGSQNLGDVTGNTYIGQPYLYPATATVFGIEYWGTFRLAMKKVGSPTGTITVSLYSNNAGVPGTSQAVSNYTMSAANLTTSLQQIEFWSDARFKHSFSTTYHIVIQYSGTIDGSNYVQIDKNGSGTTLNASSNGTSWSAGSGSLRFVVGVMNLECVSPVVKGNSFTLTNSSTITHCCILNTTDGGTFSQNQLYGGSLGIVTKLVDGSVHALQVSANAASFSLTNSAGEAAYYSKGSKQGKWYQNTAFTSAGNNGCQEISSDFDTTLATNYNGTPSRNETVENCIYCTLGNSSSTAITVGTGNAKDYTVIGLTLNNNLYFVGGSAAFGLANLGQTASVVSYSTLSAWQAGTGLDSASKYGDPLLTNDTAPAKASDFVPTSGSPALGIGLNLSASVPNDLLGNPYSVNPPLGALNGFSRGPANSRSYANSRTILPQ